MEDMNMIEETGGGMMITGIHVKLYRMLSMRGAIKLESMGMKHSRGSITALAKREFGWTGNRAKILALLDAEIEKFKAEHPADQD
jgi:hypothetical protein